VADNTPTFVQLAMYYSVEEAELARSQLEVDGIAAHVEGQHAVGVMPMQAIALGGVRLMVRPHDVERAREVLGALSSTPTNGAGQAPIPVDEGDAWMRRASFAAFLGISACPFVGTVYSIILLARYGSLPRSSRGTLHRNLALAFDVLAVGLVALWRLRA
jgi:hypothetical protein